MDFTASSSDELFNELTGDATSDSVKSEAETIDASIGEHSTMGNSKDNDKFAKLRALCVPFDTSRPVEKTELIGGLFPRGYVSVIVAPSGTGKSLFIQKVFTDLSIGGEFLKGHDGDDNACLVDNEPARKCVILCGELGEQGLRERATEFDLHPNSENVIVLDQTACEAAHISFMLDSTDGIANLEFIARTKPDILFIDSFSAFFGGKENDNSECNAVFGTLRRIASQHQVAIVLCHHSRKRLSTEQSKPLTLDDVVGSGAITRHVYSVIAIEFKSNTKINLIASLKCWGKKFKTFGYAIRYGLYEHPHIEIDFAPQELDDEKVHANTSNTGQKAEWQIKLCGFLLGKGKQGATRDEILEAIGEDGIERDTFIKRITRMKDKGEIVKIQRGRYALPEDKLIQTEKDNEKDNEPDRGKK